MSEPSYDHILYDVADRTATITFNRPDVLNAVNLQMGGELRDGLVQREQRVEDRRQHGWRENVRGAQPATTVSRATPPRSGAPRAGPAVADAAFRYGRIFSPSGPSRLRSGFTRSSRETPIHITSGAITSTDE